MVYMAMICHNESSSGGSERMNVQHYSALLQHVTVAVEFRNFLLLQKRLLRSSQICRVGLLRLAAKVIVDRSMSNDFVDADADAGANNLVETKIRLFGC